MTNLKLVREKTIQGTTLGRLYVNNNFYCDTLEDAIRDFGKDGKGKIKHHTAIPKGKYRIIINQSRRFKRLMPLVLNVPFFEGIRIHAGNTIANTSGCILVGRRVSDGKIMSSVRTFERFYNDCERWLKMGGVMIEIVE